MDKKLRGQTSSHGKTTSTMKAIFAGLALLIFGISITAGVTYLVYYAHPDLRLIAQEAIHVFDMASAYSSMAQVRNLLWCATLASFAGCILSIIGGGAPKAMLLWRIRQNHKLYRSLPKAVKSRKLVLAELDSGVARLFTVTKRRDISKLVVAIFGASMFLAMSVLVLASAPILSLLLLAGVICLLMRVGYTSLQRQPRDLRGNVVVAPPLEEVLPVTVANKTDLLALRAARPVRVSKPLRPVSPAKISKPGARATSGFPAKL